MDLFLEIYVLQANFCWLGDLERITSHLEGKCCWEIDNAWYLRGFYVCMKGTLALNLTSSSKMSAIYSG